MLSTWPYSSIELICEKELVTKRISLIYDMKKTVAQVINEDSTTFSCILKSFVDWFPQHNHRHEIMCITLNSKRCYKYQHKRIEAIENLNVWYKNTFKMS